MDDRIKKNLLDLEYNKHLQYLNTTVIILFTYFIGVVITLVTGQFNYNNKDQLFLGAFLSMGVMSTTVILMLRFRVHLKNITEEIKKLNL